MLEVAVSQQDGGVEQGSIRSPERLTAAQTTQKSLRGLPIVAKVLSTPADLVARQLFADLLLQINCALARTFFSLTRSTSWLWQDLSSDLLALP